MIPKRTFSVESQQKLNYATSIIKENGLEIINSNTLEDLDIIDFKQDLYNPYHINVVGATKNTLYFAKYFKEKYGLEDHRDTNTDSSWNTEYERFEKVYNILTKQNFDDMLANFKNIYPDLF